MAIWRDVLHAGRALAEAPAFTVVCVATLGIGMAPAIAIQYGARVFTTPPPLVDTSGLVEVVTTRVGPQEPTDRWSYPDFAVLRDARTGVAIVGWATGERDVVLPASGEQATAQAIFVSSGYFRTVGVPLARGPGLQETTEPVVVLAHRFWQRRLASDPDIVGKPIVVGGVPHVVAGVAADGFSGHLAFQDAELFLPLERHPGLLTDAKARFDRRTAWVRIHGRLSGGLTVTQAGAAVAALTAELAREHPATNERIAGTVAQYHAIGSLEAGNLPIIMAVWHAMTALPLLVVCLNVSGMVQVRSAIRERELSIRQAIGASRQRLMQHLLAEAVVLAAAGGALAAMVLFSIPPVASWWLGEPIPPQLREALRVDFSLLATLAGLCLATSLVFGWLPALRFSRPAIMTVLKDDAGSGGVRVGRFHRLTAALQIAIAVPLLVLSFLSLERLRATAAADLGFAADDVYAAPVDLEASAAAAAFQIRRMRDALASASGVAAATVADGLPLDFRYRNARVSTEAAADAAPKGVTAHVTRVGAGYLEAMGIALVGGRGFRPEDEAGSPLVTVISATLAATLYPDVDAIGQRLTFAVPGDQKTPRTLIVVGVTADFPTSQMSTGREQLLLPLAQHPDIQRDAVPVVDDRGGRTRLMLIARSTAGESPATITAALDNAIRDVDAGFNRRAIVSGVWLRENSMADFLNQVAFGGISGGVTLLLAALGIYGVVGLMVTTRTREVAVRVTLGASRRRVIGMILGDVVTLAAPGVGVGLLVTIALVRLEGGISVGAIEPLAYAAGAAVAMLTAVAAGLAPARRAASVPPMVAMRST
jgi:predicted permease